MSIMIREVFQLAGPKHDPQTTICMIEDGESEFATLSIASNDENETASAAICMTPFLALELADKLRAWAEARANERRGAEKTS